MSIAVLAGVGGSGPVNAFAATRVTTTTANTGYDVSYPQCSSSLPRGGSFAIVGVNDGRPWPPPNPCLVSEFNWAAGKPQAPGLVMNTANPGPVSVHWTAGGPRACDGTFSVDCSYNYGWNAAADAFNTASSALTVNPATLAWWLDVETTNSWDGSSAANAADLQGSVDYFHIVGVKSVGVYSTGYQWGLITGGYHFATKDNVVDWVAGATSLKGAQQRCGSSYSFTGGPVKLAQYPNNGFDGDYRCY